MARRKVAIAVALFAVAAPVAAQAVQDAVPPTPFPLTRGYLIGNWTDSGNCATAVDFRFDGSFVTSKGATGTWTLDGNQLRMLSQSEVLFTVVPEDGRVVRLFSANGKSGKSTRC